MAHISFENVKKDDRVVLASGNIGIVTAVSPQQFKVTVETTDKVRGGVSSHYKENGLRRGWNNSDALHYDTSESRADYAAAVQAERNRNAEQNRKIHIAAALQKELRQRFSGASVNFRYSTFEVDLGFFNEAETEALVKNLVGKQ